MADTKVSALTASADATASDLLYLVDEATTSKKITFANFQTSIDHDVLTNYSADEHFTSNALWTAINLNTAKVSYTDEALVDATVASCALNTSHREDSSDPHGATLSQTYLNVASCAITADNTTVSMAFVRNLVFGTSATPPTASDFTQGTVYLQYTP